ncbi:hypothetical protein ACFQ0B_23010 [Nonomuraea thailandensis]
MAKVLGTSANVVRVRLYRARRRFARRLTEAGIHHSRAVAFEGSRL